MGVSNCEGRRAAIQEESHQSPLGRGRQSRGTLMGDDDRRTAGDGRRIPRVLARDEHERRRAVEECIHVGALVQQLRRHDRGAVQDRVV